MIMRPLPAVFGLRMVIHVKRVRMQMAQVIDVDVVLDDDLPVGLDFIALARFGIFHQLLGFVRPKMGVDRTKPFGQRRRVWVGMDEQHPTPDVDAGGLQAKAFFVDPVPALSKASLTIRQFPGWVLLTPRST